MGFLRTPDDRFENLKDYSFSPNYTEVDDSDGGGHFLQDARGAELSKVVIGFIEDNPL